MMACGGQSKPSSLPSHTGQKAEALFPPHLSPAEGLPKSMPGTREARSSPASPALVTPGPLSCGAHSTHPAGHDWEDPSERHPLGSKVLSREA